MGGKGKGERDAKMGNERKIKRQEKRFESISSFFSSPEQIFHRKEIYEMIDHNNRREKILITINVVTSIGRGHWSSCTRRAKHRYFG